MELLPAKALTASDQEEGVINKLRSACSRARGGTIAFVARPGERDRPRGNLNSTADARCKRRSNASNAQGMGGHAERGRPGRVLACTNGAEEAFILAIDHVTIFYVEVTHSQGDFTRGLLSKQRN